MLSPRIRCRYCGDVIQSDRESVHQSCNCGRVSVLWHDADYHIDYPNEPPELWLEIIDEEDMYFDLAAMINFIQDRMLELGYAARAEDIGAVLDAQKEFWMVNDAEEEGQ